jgi:hypothetical protein
MRKLMINPEDTKLVTLAQSTLKRSGSLQASALRDTTGRTYVAINVVSPALILDSLEAVLTVALASGISGIESVVTVGEKPLKPEVIRAFAADATLFYVNSEGAELSL